MEDHKTDRREEADTDEKEEDPNIYGLLLEVISKNEADIDKQQKNLKEIAGVMYKPTVPRRLFRVLFPSVESTRRVR